MSHFHHKIVGYTTIEGSQVTDGVEIVVDMCKTEKEALAKAKTLVKRKGYILQKVWECDTCTQNQEQLANQRYLTALLANALKQ